MITALSLSPAVDKICFVDGFEPGGLYRVGNMIRSAGGKGINVARVASMLGERVTVAGFVAGQTGAWIESQLAGLGVTSVFIPVEGESRTNINIIDRQNGTETEILETGPIIREKDVKAFVERFNSLLEKTSVLVCSGGLPEGVPSGFYRTLIEMAGRFGIKVVLDTSNELLAEGIKAKPYMVKPNLRELSGYAGRRLVGIDDVREACMEIISQGVGVVVASMGKEGALLVSEDISLLARVPDVAAVNTIGSGDSMVAGLAAGLARGCSMEDFFRLGMACAVSNAQFAEIGFIDCDMVERYHSEIEIQMLAGGRTWRI